MNPTSASGSSSWAAWTNPRPARRIGTTTGCTLNRLAGASVSGVMTVVSIVGSVSVARTNSSVPMRSRFWRNSAFGVVRSRMRASASTTNGWSTTVTVTASGLNGSPLSGAERGLGPEQRVAGLDDPVDDAQPLGEGAKALLTVLIVTHSKSSSVQRSDSCSWRISFVIDVSLISRLSVFRVTRKRSRRSKSIGCSAIDPTTPVLTFDVGHSSSGMRVCRGCTTPAGRGARSRPAR